MESQRAVTGIAEMLLESFRVFLKKELLALDIGKDL